ncbi:hypothetical protein ACQKQD_18625 [Methylobacterium sp. NPDC080182]|uniref:hypothetical protein n=1 Tax=Methylobacterium sp. NPDC080182 TaxID=3390590 RepID=UPI003CFFFEF8
MAVSYITAAATQRLQVVADGMQGKTYAASTGTASAPSLVIGTSSFVNTQGTASVTSSTTGVLAIIPLPTGGISVSGRTLTLISSAQSATASGSGTAANAAIITNAGTIHTGGLTVGTSGTDVVIGATAISSGQQVTVSSATINHPA